MKKIGLLFPGQGSQYVGMGKELFDQNEVVKETFNKADAALGFNLSKIIFEGPEETLKQTQYTQPAIFTLSASIFNILNTKGLLSSSSIIGAGHSLGEYSALYAAGIYSFDDGIKLVRARGEFIRKASENNPGAMAAIIGLEKDQVKQICSEAAQSGVCEAVNFNCPGQIVIAGTKESVNKAVETAQKAGATKAVVLNVSGPFHSSLMKSASEMMEQELKKYKFSKPKFQVITNCDAQLNSNAEEIPGKLVRQINSAVLWEDSIKRMIENGVELFIELGPQRVLSGLNRRIDKTKKMLNIEDVKSLEKTLQEIQS